MGPGSPRTPTSDMALCGVYYGIVTQNQDPEELGRVKVRFPWLPGGDQDQSAWARVSVPMVGAEFGTYTLPEVEDTVLVVFLAGDVDHPVVIGGMWNRTDTPPDTNENGKNDFRFIKSRSGHRLLFDDSGSASVALTDRTDQFVAGCGTFAAGGDGPSKLEIPAPKPYNGSGDKGVAISSMGGKLNLWCPNGTLKLKGNNVELTATDKLEVKASSDIQLEGAKAKVCSASTGKYQGGKVKIGP